MAYIHKRNRVSQRKGVSKLSMLWEFRAGCAFPTNEVGKASGNTQADLDGDCKGVGQIGPCARLTL